MSTPTSDRDLLPALPAPTGVAASGSPAAVVSLQQRLVERAVEAGASDLHVEPRDDRIRVRLRIDGWLHDLDPLPAWLHDGLVARFKVVAGMDVTERRRPQDGRASTAGPDGAVDLRVASLPTRHGEKIVVRLLPRERRPRQLEDLGLDAAACRRLAGMVARSQGLILAAGPTGAGKTTTLYALLRRVDPVGRHVVTLEDPVEYSLPDVVQVPVRRRVGVDFAAALRAVLRQDPDVILVGEIRDEETARIAVQAAATGHLVLSTVHTNSALESVVRLVDLGAPRFLVAAALLGIVSQRLVRRLCRHCRRPDRPAAASLAALGLPPPGPGRTYWQGAGCGRCRDGFAGRLGLFETLALDGELRRRLATSGTVRADDPEAIARGLLRPLVQAARQAVEQGETTVSEVTRVVASAGRGDDPGTGGDPPSPPPRRPELPPA